MKKILVVVDMQNDFIDGALGTKEAEAIVDKVVNKINSYNDAVTVLATMDTHDYLYLETPEGKKLPVPHCYKFTDGWALNKKIYDAIVCKEDFFIIEKPTFGSFELVKEISSIASHHTGDVTVELVGLCTDICIVSNAIMIKNHLPKCEVVVDASCCAGVTPETHRAALVTMKQCQIDVIGE